MMLSILASLNWMVRLRVDLLALMGNLLALLPDMLKHLCGQLGSGSGAQTDKVLGLKLIHAEHVGIVLNPHRHVN
jgi:hypothetical protein